MKIDWMKTALSDAKPSSPYIIDNQSNIDECIDKTTDKQDNDDKILDEFIKNEINNRELKPKLLKIVYSILILQIIFTSIIVIIVILSLVCGNSHILFIHKIDTSICKNVLSFLKYYISATIVELLAIFYFIVKQVFGNNVLEMFKANSNKNNTKKQK